MGQCFGEFLHCTQATSKDLRANLPAKSTPRRICYSGFCWPRFLSFSEALRSEVIRFSRFCSCLLLFVQISVTDPISLRFAKMIRAFHFVFQTSEPRISQAFCLGYAVAWFASVMGTAKRWVGSPTQTGKQFLHFNFLSMSFFAFISCIKEHIPFMDW